MENCSNQGVSTSKGKARGRARWAMFGAFAVVGMAGNAQADDPAELGPAVSSDGGFRLDLFAIGRDKAVWHKRRDGGFGPWERLPAIVASTAPDAVSQAPGKIDVVVVQKDAKVWISSFNGSWSAWTSLGGYTLERPAICSWGPGRLDVFTRHALDDSLQHRAFQGGVWSAWESLGGVLRSAPDCVSWGPNRIDVVVKGTDWAVHHRAWAGGWYGWDSLGGAVITAPTIASWAAGRLDVFARGTDWDHNIYHRAYESGWYGWDNIEGSDPGNGAPAAVSTANLDVEVAFRSFWDGNIQLRVWDHTFGWLPWTDVGAPPQ